jgi:hypothetical protein
MKIIRKPTLSTLSINAAWLKEHLQPFGWDTVAVDFHWYDTKADGIRVQDPEGVAIDEYGRCGRSRTLKGDEGKC